MLLPVPGHQCKDMTDLAILYSNILKNYNLDVDCFNLSEIGIIYLGYLRRLLIKPRNFQWKEPENGCLDVTFEPPSSCYATVLLQEIVSDE
eukprot:UN16211